MGTLQPENDMKQELNDSGCVQDACVTDSYKGSARLLDLSDDVLLCILRHCTPRDLKALGHTCPRLGALICDHTLWTHVDARDTRTGLERLKWFLNYCLTTSTQELQLTGYADKFIRCLGIQDLTWSGENPNAPGRDPAAPLEVEHFLLRMWYPHLPRYAMSPRWPDKREQEGKAYSGLVNPEPPLSPLSQLASEIVDNVAAASSHTSRMAQRSEASTSKETEKKKTEDKKRAERSGRKCTGPQFTINQNILRNLRIKCQNLRSLVLEYCNLDYRNTNLKYFPPTLKKLSLRGTRCYNLPLNTSYLGKVQDRLPELEYLDVSECEWFEPASLMPLSKVPKLEELYMRECKRLTECVAYASLATRYGFQKLKILDMRGSPVADSEVSAFGWLPLLEELYVSPPDESKEATEHSHSWNDVFEPFVELDPWEAEVPEYFRSKSPCVDSMDEEDEVQEEVERPDPVMSTANCERRIIVIHPNRPNELPIVNQIPPAPPPDNEPAEPPPEDLAQPGPSRPLNRPSGSNQPQNRSPGSNGTQNKSPGPSKATPGSSKSTPGPSNSTPGPSKSTPGPSKSTPGLSNSTPGPSKSTPGPSKSTPGSSKSTPGSSKSTPGPSKSTPGPSKSTPGPSKSTPGPSQPRNKSPGPKRSLRLKRSPGSLNGSLSEAHQSNKPGPSKRPNEDCALNLVKRRRIDKSTNTDFSNDDHGDDEMSDDSERPLKDNPRKPTNNNPQSSPHNLRRPKDDPKKTPNKRSPKDDKKSPKDDKKSPKGGKKSPKDDKKPPKDDNKRPPQCRTTRLPKDKPTETKQDNDEPQPSTSRQVGLSLGANIIPLHPDDHISKVAVKIHKGYVREHLAKGSTQPPLASVSVNIRPMPFPSADDSDEEDDEEDNEEEENEQEEREESPEKEEKPQETCTMQLRSRKRLSENKESSPENRKRPANRDSSPENEESSPENEDSSPENEEESPENGEGSTTYRFARLLPVDRPFFALGQQNDDSSDDNNVVLWDRPDGQEGRRYVPGEESGPGPHPQPVMHIDIDIQRQPLNMPQPILPNFSYHVVSDSAVLRFGRAENDNINYVHIGQSAQPNDPGVRPERSNLRVLSITGFRNITDRSLEHLATAAPHIRHIDFSNTGVTARGVEVFRAIRPNCEVIFSDNRRKSHTMRD